MLDYHGDCVALGTFVDTLGAASFPDPAVAAAQREAMEAVGREPGPALLGAFVQQLLCHAAADGWELALLRRAADLWRRGQTLCDQLGAIRADLEGAMEHPADPGSAERFNTAALRAQEFANEMAGIRAEIDELRADALTFRHLPRHPRQADLGTDAWDWGNLQLARRTDAFVRALFQAAGDARSLSFAVGAACAYGANVAGSAYLGHTVGGLRRTHRHRDRLARNTVGSWLAAHHPKALPLTAMADQVRFGQAGTTELPTDLAGLIGTALVNTFDTTRTAPLPDLGLGYQRLLEHLELLDAFRLPAEPPPPGQVWMNTLWSDPGAPPPSLRPQDVDVVGQDGGGVAVQYGPGEPGSHKPDGSDGSKTAKGCGIGIVVIILFDLLQAFIQCIGQWANHHTCTFWKNMLLSKVFEKDPPDPRDPTNPGVTQDQLTAIAATPQAAEFVGLLSDSHGQAWEAMSRARTFLASTGLVYPADLAGLPLFEQFTAVPAVDGWPHREVADPEASYHSYPVSPIEHPATEPPPFPTGANPEVFLEGGSPLQAATVTLGLWGQIAANEHSSRNLDLDADRGFGHPCWTAGNSVQTDPIDVSVLDYDDQ
ncbi:hypothetical protein [Kitasatospora sp. NPDC002965]|uniref:hypothetical protein n=1 Tax=Kitasatospora sp. NPDC002965 TaxID=3154775 RepID=UPI0033BAD631